MPEGWGAAVNQSALTSNEIAAVIAGIIRNESEDAKVRLMAVKLWFERARDALRTGGILADIERRLSGKVGDPHQQLQAISREVYVLTKGTKSTTELLQAAVAGVPTRPALEAGPYDDDTDGIPAEFGDDDLDGDDDDAI